MLAKALFITYEPFEMCVGLCREPAPPVKYPFLTLHVISCICSSGCITDAQTTTGLRLCQIIVLFFLIQICLQSLCWESHSRHTSGMNFYSFRGFFSSGINKIQPFLYPNTSLGLCNCAYTVLRSGGLAWQTVFSTLLQHTTPPGKAADLSKFEHCLELRKGRVCRFYSWSIQLNPHRKKNHSKYEKIMHNSLPSK